MSNSPSWSSFNRQSSSTPSWSVFGLNRNGTLNTSNPISPFSGYSEDNNISSSSSPSEVTSTSLNDE